MRWLMHAESGWVFVFAGQVTDCACVHKEHAVLTCRWCVVCRRIEPGTPAPLWWDEHAGLDKVSREVALVTNSNEGTPALEKCRSSAELRDKEIFHKQKYFQL